MTLKEVLNCIVGYTDLQGYPIISLIYTLFEKYEIKNGKDLIVQDIYNAEKDASLKQISAGTRGFHRNITASISTQDGFMRLQKEAKEQVCPLIGEKVALYDDLTNMIQSSKRIPSTQKEYLSTIFIDSDKEALLPTLISTCIVIGNYITLLDTSNSTASNGVYSLSLDFLSNNDASFRTTIWEASKNAFKQSRMRGGRFYNINIIDCLLPRGYVSNDDIIFHLKASQPELQTLQGICNDSTENVAITGEGGIGKTTFLQKIMELSYMTESKECRSTPMHSYIPIFIELNRCPINISESYDPKYQKTNFITQYIADMVQASLSYHFDMNEMLENIELDFRRTPINDQKTYLLLLDGFNEVSTQISSDGESVRALLSQEISALNMLPNVRIITTSRITQSAYYTSKFKRVTVEGLTSNDISAFLRTKSFSDTQIGHILANKELMNCIKVPLFLCIFSTKTHYEDFEPETRGEILYNFFHKNGNYYNIRQRAIEAHNNPLQHIPYATELILDFILPHIGWTMSQNDTFYLTEKKLQLALEDAMLEVGHLLKTITKLPLSDFDNSIVNALKAYDAIQNTREPFTELPEQDLILVCIIEYLSIMYKNSLSLSSKSSENSYSFIHHYFRDYFSAVWNLQIIRLTPLKDLHDDHYLIHKSIADNYWNEQELEIIGQLLMENHNKPILSERTQNWHIPNPVCEEQTLLTALLDFIRQNEPLYIHDKKIIFQNIINTYASARGEISGVHFDKLDLRGCNIHGITCSKKGKTETLFATFNGCKLNSSFLEPKEHLDIIQEIVYVDNFCLTVDSYSCVKEWDVISGNQIKTFNTSGEYDSDEHATTGFIRISNDNKLFAVKSMNFDEGYPAPKITVFHTSSTMEYVSTIDLPNKHKNITDFCFFDNVGSLLILADKHTLYVYIYNPKEPHLTLKYQLAKQIEIPELLDHTRMSISNDMSHVYFFSYKYNEAYPDPDEEYDDEEEWYDDEDWENDDIEPLEDDINMDTVCEIYKYNIESTEVTLCTSFTSAPDTKPAFTFIPTYDSYLIYDQNSESIKIYNCADDEYTPVLHSILDENDGIMPDSMHFLRGSHASCYIMYFNKCYLVDINPYGNTTILIPFDAPGLLNQDSTTISTELNFWVNTAPTRKRILLFAENGNMYEWNIEESEPIYKYNIRTFDCVAMFRDKKRDLFIMIHEQNGIDIFSLSQKRLVNAVCFKEKDYRIRYADYSKENGLLALTFERDQHYFIRLFSIDDSTVTDLLSLVKPCDDTTQVHWNNTGTNLVISTPFYCYDYDCKTGKLSCVYEQEANEWISAAYYSTPDELHIGIASAKSYLTPIIKPRCEIYKRTEDGSFKFVNGYFIPELPEGLKPDFIHKNHDIGCNCEKDSTDRQAYTITRGFFAKTSKKIKSFMTLPAFTKDSDNNIVEAGTYTVSPYSFLQVKHSYAIDYITKKGVTQNCYSYLEDDLSEATCIYDYETVSYWNDYKNHPDKFSTYDYHNSDAYEESGGGSLYWDYAIPDGNGMIICCTENYRLFVSDIKTGKTFDEINYQPGLAIAGCKFKNITCKDDDVLEIIKENGGIVQ